MPSVTITPTACSAGIGWKTLYYHSTTNDSYTTRQLIFTYPANAALAQPGINITGVTLRGTARNSSSAIKRLRLGFKPGTDAAPTVWATHSGYTLLDSAFTAVSASSSGDYITKSFARSYAGTTLASRMAGHLRARFANGQSLYLGVVQPDSENSIQVNTTLTNWKITVTYELLGNVPTNDVTEAALGETKITTTVARVLEDSATTLQYKIGATVVHTVDLGAGTTAEYLPPGELGAHFPDAKTAALTITAETTLDGASYGSVSSTVTLTLPEDAAPVCAVTHAVLWPESTPTENQLDAYVRQQSGAQFAIAAQGRYGAAIVSYRTVIEGAAYDGANPVHLPVLGSGEIPWSCTVTDSRGLSVVMVGSLTALPWSEPSISGFEIRRVTDAGIEAIDGTYAWASFSAAVSPVSISGVEQNRLHWQVEYREIAQGDAPEKPWIACDGATMDGTTADVETLLTSNGAAVGGGGVDGSGENLPFHDMAGYEFRLTVRDLYASSAAMDAMPTKAQYWDVDDDTGKMGFGGDAPAAEEPDSYRFYGPIDARGGIHGMGEVTETASNTGTAASGASFYSSPVTVTEDGLYLCIALAGFASGSITSTSYCRARIERNGSEVVTTSHAQSPNYPYIQTIWAVQCVAGDTLRTQVMHISSSSKTCWARLQVIRLK